MILRLLHAGKPPRGALSDAADDYRGRLRRAAQTEEIFVRAQRLHSEGPAEVAKALAVEGKRLLDKVDGRDRLVALKIHAKGTSSEELARRLRGWKSGGHRAICFALGSSHGLDTAVIERADETLSFGPLTLPHDLARVVLWEQLYRASTILAGSPYHK